MIRRLSSTGWNCAIAFALMLMMASSVFAVDVPAGPATGTWTRENNPYRILGEVTVPNGASLFISAGVQIEFTGPYAIRVDTNATIIMRGDSISGSLLPTIDTIRVSSTPGAPDANWGRGIRCYSSSSSSQIHYVNFSNLHARGVWPENNGGALFFNGTSVDLKGLEFYKCRADFYGGAIHFWFASTNLEQALFDSCSSLQGGGAVDMWYSTLNAKFVTAVKNRSLDRNGGSFLVGSFSELIFSHSIVWSNSNDSGLVNIGERSSYRASFSYWTGLSGNNCIVPKVGDSRFTLAQQFGARWVPSTISYFVDSGDPNLAVGSEPAPNGGRINIGYYAGTSWATQSLPVGIIERGSDPNVAIQLGDEVKLNTPYTKTRNFKNISHARLAPLRIRNIVSPDSTILFDFNGQLTQSILAADTVLLLEPDSSFRMRVQVKAYNTGAFSKYFTYEWTSSSSSFIRDSIQVTGTAINPKIQAGSDSVNFGLVALFDTVTTSVPLYNTGTTPLSIRAVNITSNTPFNGFFGRADSVSATIQPGDSTRLILQFFPDTVRLLRANAIIGNNDASIIIRLMGSGLGAYAAVDSLHHSGFLTRGTTRIYPLRIYSGGNQPLVIDSIKFNKRHYAQGFTGPLTIAVSDSDSLLVRPRSLDVPIVFQPDTIGTDTSIGTIYTNYGLSSRVPARTLRFKIYGRGVVYGNYLYGVIPDTQLTAAGSPYVITDTVTIPVTGVLRMTPGTDIRFEPGSTLLVRGRVVAQGTSANPILLGAYDSSNFRKPYLNLIETTNNNILSFVHFTGPQYDNTSRSPLVNMSQASASFDHCWFSNGKSASGAAIYSNISSATLVRNRFFNNTATNGGAIYAIDSRINSTRNVYRYNTATAQGGVAYIRNNTFVQSRNDAYDHNHAQKGAVWASGNPATFTGENNVFFANVADSTGAIAYTSQTSVRVHSSLMINNVGTDEFTGPVGVTPALLSYNLNSRENAAYTAEAMWGTDTTEFQLLSAAPAIDHGDITIETHNDYYFPPAQGTAFNDAGITGGPYNGVGELRPMGILLYTNPAVGEFPDVAVYTYDADMQLDSVIYTPDQQTSRALQFTTVAGSNLYYTRVPATGSALLTAVAHYTTSSQLVRVSRRVGVLNSGTMSLGPWSIRTGNGNASIAAALSMNDTDPSFGPTIEIQTAESREYALTFTGAMAADKSVVIERRTSTGWELAGRATAGSEGYTALIHGAGEFRISSIENEGTASGVPASFALSDAFPNPFNPSTKLSLAISQSGSYRAVVIDITGREVAELFHRNLTAGTHTISWDGMNAMNMPVASGIYLIKVSGVAETATRKVILLK